MLSKSLETGTTFLQDIKHLKRHSKYFPEILACQIGERLYASTIVRFERAGVWFTIHVVDYVEAGTNIDDVAIVTKSLIRNAWDAYHLHTMHHAEKDEIQVSEAIRLQNERP